MLHHLSTEDVPERDRFEVWNNAIFNTLAISVRPLPDAEGPFRAHLSARSSGSLLNCRFNADGFRATRQNSEIAHQHWDSYWIVRESGPGAWHKLDGQEIISQHGDLIIGDTDTTSDTYPVSRYNHELWVVPKALVDPHLPARGLRPFTLLSGRDGVDALAAVYLDTLTKHWDSIAEPAMAQVTDTLCRLIGIACGAMAADQPDALRAGRLTRAKRHIDRHLADPNLSPATTAAVLGIAVRTLHLLFEPTGNSFARYVLRRRLEECRTALLANPNRPVTDIAFAWGFNNLSTFYRAFQATFGLTPGDLRATSREERHF